MRTTLSAFTAQQGLLRRSALKRGLFALVSLSIALSTIGTPAFAADTVVGVGPTVRLAAAGEGQVLIQWDSPQTSIENAAHEFVGPSGFQVKVSNPGSESELRVASTCDTLTASDFDCVFLQPLNKHAFDVRVRAKFTVDGATQYSGWGFAQIDVSSMTHIENLQAEPTDLNDLAVAWSNASAAAQGATSAKVYVDGVLKTTVAATVDGAPDTAEVTGVAVGSHTIVVTLFDGLTQVATQSLAYVQPDVPASPVVTIETSAGAGNTEIAIVSWLPNQQSTTTVTGWDVVVFTDAAADPYGCEAIVGTARECVLTGLDPTASYEIAVRAIYGIGQLGEAGYARLRISPVENLVVEPTSASDALIFWSINPVIEPQVSSAAVLVNGVAVTCPDAMADLSCAVDGLEVGINYNFQVVLYDENDVVIGSASSGLVTWSGKPAAPTVVIAPENEQGVSVVTWSYAGGTPEVVTGYDVTAYSFEGDLLGSCTDISETDFISETCNLAGIAPVQGVMVEVRAMYGRGALGEPGRAWLHVTPIADLAAVTSGAGSMNLSWTLDVIVDTLMSDVVVTVDGVEAACPDATNLSTCELTGLLTGHTYAVVVSAQDASGNVIAEESIDVTPQPAPSAPVIETSVSGSTLTLSWFYGEGTVPSTVTGWEVAVSSDAATVLGTCSDLLPSGVMTCQITNYNASKTYAIEVAATYGADLVGPTGYAYRNLIAIDGLSVATAGPSAGLASWTLDPFLDARVAAVIVKLDGTTLDCPEALEFSECYVYDLVANGDYTISVEAFDDNGTSLGTASQLFVFAGEPSAPTVEMSAISGGQAIITWSYLDDLAASGITGWDVVVQTQDGAEVGGTCELGAFAVETVACSVTGLTANTKLEVAVSGVYGVNLLGKTGYVYSAAVTPVEDYSTSMTGAEEVTVSWALDAFYDARVVAAQIRLTDIATEVESVIDCPDAATFNECALGGLTVGGEYIADVTFFDANDAVVTDFSVSFRVEAAPIAPNVSITAQGANKLVSWSYSGVGPDNIVGWEVTVLTDGLDAAGTCYNDSFAAAATSCTLTGIDATAGYQVEVTPLYGANLRGESAFAYFGVDTISDVQLVRDVTGSGFVSWKLFSLFEERADSVKAYLDQTEFTCEDAFLNSLCAVGDLNDNASYDVRLVFYAGDTIIGSYLGTVFVTQEPEAPELSVNRDAQTNVATLSWSYPSGVPSGVTGLALAVVRGDGLDAVGTCADLVFEASESGSCTLTGVTSTTEVSFEMRAAYGLDLLSSPKFYYLNVTPISDLTSVTSAAGEVTLSWQVATLVEPQVDSVVVYETDTETVLTCPDAETFQNCVVELAAGTTKSISVKLVDADGNEIAVATIAAKSHLAPVAPVVNVETNGDGTATVNWNYTPRDNDANDGVNGWQVVVDSDSLVEPSGDCLTTDFISTDDTCTIAVEADAKYIVEVRAIYGDNLVGEMGFGTSFNATPQLVVTPAADGTAALTWDVDPLVADRLSDVIVSIGNEMQICPDAFEFSNCDLTGLELGTQYSLRVALIDTNGQLWTVGQKTYTYEGVPTAPTVTVSDVVDGTSTVEWGYANDAYSTLIDGWQIVVSGEGGATFEGTCSDIAFAAGTTGCTITGLAADTAVAVAVNATYGDGLASPNGFGYLNVAAVSAVDALTSGTGEVTVGWTLHELVSDRVDSVTVSVDGEVQTCPTALADADCVISGLTPDAQYTVEIKAFDGDTLVGSETTTATAHSPPSAPTVTVTLDGTNANVSWSFANGTPAWITGWFVDVAISDGSGATGTCTGSVSANTTTCTIANVDLDLGYEITVAAEYGTDLTGAVGFGYVSVDTLSNLQVIPSADTQATAIWTIDSLMASRVANVAVFVNGTAVVCPDAEVDASCILDLMIAGDEYEVSVYAYDADGVELDHAIVLYTHVLPSIRPTNFTAVLDDAANVTLTWDFSNAEASLMTGWDLVITSDYDPELTNVTVVCELPNGSILPATRSCVVTGLQISDTDQLPDAAYFFALRTSLGDGVFGAPAYASVRTTPVEGLNFLPVSRGSATATWNTGFGWSSVIDSYNVKQDGTLVCSTDGMVGCTFDLAAGLASEITIEGLDASGEVISTTVENYSQPTIPVVSDITSQAVDNELTVEWVYDAVSSTAVVNDWAVTVEDKHGELVTGTCFEGNLDGSSRSCTVVMDDASFGNKITVAPIYGDQVIGDELTVYRGPVSTVEEIGFYPVFESKTTVDVAHTEVVGVTEYGVEVTDASGATSFVMTQQDALTWRAADITPGDDLVATVRTRVDGVESFFATTSEVYTAPDVPMPVTNLKVVPSGTAGEARVTWTLSETRGIGVIVYRVFATAPGYPTFTSTVAKGVAMPNSLAAGVEYTFTVIAMSYIGNSEPMAITMQMAKVPAAPTITSVGLVDASTARVDWEASVPSDDRAPVTSYVVTADPSEGIPSVTVTADATSAVIPNLVEGVEYTFTVKAVSQVGKSTPATSAKLLAPNMSSSVTTKVNGLSAQINWQSAVGAVQAYVLTVTDSNGDVTTHRVNANTVSHVLSDLTPGASYSYKISALYLDYAGNETVNADTIDFTFSVQDVPNVPTVNTSLLATDSIRATMGLGAPNAARATATNVIVEVNSPDGQIYATTIPASTRSATVSGLSAGVGYTARAKATSAVGDSAWSDWSTILYTPAAVSDLAVDPSGPTSALLTWTAPLGVVTGYTITATPNSGTVIKLSAEAAATSASLTRLEIGKTYTISVQANFGSYYVSASQTSLQVADVPLPPVASSVVLASASSATVTWQQSLTAPKRSAVTGYQIIVNPAAGVVAPTVGADETSAVISNLSAGTTYTVTVKATSEVGVSIASNSVSVYTPVAPTAVKAVASNADLTVSWVGSRGLVTGYRVTLTGDDASEVSFDVASNATSKLFAGLTPGVTYTPSVVAVYGDSIESTSAVGSSARILDVPLAPTITTVRLASVSSMTSSWNAPATEVTRAAVTGYQYEVRALEVGQDAVEFQSGSTAVNTRSLTSLNLVSGVGYSIRVQALSLVGNSEWTAWSNTLWAPSAPTDVTVEEESAVSAHVNWVAPLGNVTGFAVTATATTGAVIKASAAANSTTLVLSGLRAGTTYSIVVEALYGTVRSLPSTVVTHKVLDVPSAPTLDSLALASTTSINACWTAPVTSVGRSAVTGYELTVVPAPSNAIPEIAAADTCVEITGLSASTSYKVYLKATSASGLSSASATLSRVTPGVPTAVMVKVSTTTATVSWRAPLGVVSGYVVVLKDPDTQEVIQTKELSSTSLNTSFSNLAAGKTYPITVSALFDTVTGPSASGNAVTLNVPATMAAPTLTITGLSAVKAAWVAPTAATGRVTPNGYELSVAKVDGGDLVDAPEVVVPANLSASTKNSTLTGLSSNSSYRVRVRALSTNGPAIWSDWSIEYVTPGFVSNLEATVGATNQASVSWTAPLGAVTGYTVKAVPSSGATVTVNITNGQATSATVSRLVYNMTYRITVSALYSKITAGESSAVTITAPPAPVLPNAFARPTTVLSGNKLQISYTPLTATDPVTVAGYFFLINNAAVAGCGTQAAPIATPSCAITEPALATKYTIVVKAVLRGYRATDFVFSSSAATVQLDQTAGSTTTQVGVTYTGSVKLTLTAGTASTATYTGVWLKRVTTSVRKVVG